MKPRKAPLGAQPRTPPDLLTRAARSLAGALSGAAAGVVRSAWRSAPPPPALLAERVRACLARVLSHPGAVHVSIEAPGCVVIRGAVLAWELAPLRRTVAALGVAGQIRDELTIYESAEQVSSLQASVAGVPGGRQRLADRWSPGLRLLAAVAGGGLLVGARRRGMWSALGAAAGSALLLRSALNAPFGQLARGRQRLQVRHRVRIQAPIGRVFATLRDCEGLPGLLPLLHEVRRRADGSSHWVIEGPGGTRIGWDAIATQVEVNRLIAWRTLEGARIAHWGMLRLEGLTEAHTELQLYVSYELPPGRPGRGLSRFFGAAPDSGLSRALQQLRRALESPGGSDGTSLLESAGPPGVDYRGGAT